MGVMEQILQQLKEMTEKIDSLPAAAGKDGAVLIDGKAALTTNEAKELTGIGRQNLIDMAKIGKVPHFMNGSDYRFPVRPLLKWMESEAYRNMEKKKTEKEFDIMRLTS
ncbi:helix-turn-helix domain-containing protein [Iocasia frigidifontis]|uniref:Helix-turn-helix domain-containing protein n=1 Tax=Iocasia fonsfrigidae TaxID=2682810 RepID=A0A8A7K8T2_9FIRM|nr:helix-turn-helix domain-containing protein [Iocasia fonsfrigidae]QTL96525.1 helix-turn-helix domain-containing protein [Iocasia fonsfrigidae]